MQAVYLVNSVTQPEVKQVVTFNGEDVEAMVKEVEVELVDESGKWGSRTLHFRTSEEKAYALAKYVPGTLVTLEV